MVFFNHATRQMTAKIVYYGPGLCGKTTNLNAIYGKTSTKARGEMVSLNTETDRTLFFDLLPMDVGMVGGFKTKLQLYTVPGQVFYNSTRKLVLKGVDGIVFVVDSQVPMLDASKESLQNLEENLKELGLDIKQIPMVFQWNKRDLKNVVAVEQLESELNPFGHPSFQAIAQDGSGVFETLRGVTKLSLGHIKTHVLGEGAGKAAAPAPAPPQPPPPAPAGALQGADLAMPEGFGEDTDITGISAPPELDEIPAPAPAPAPAPPPPPPPPPPPVPASAKDATRTQPVTIPADLKALRPPDPTRPLAPPPPMPVPPASPALSMPKIPLAVPVVPKAPPVKAPSHKDAISSLLGELTLVGKVGSPSTLRLDLSDDVEGQELEVVLQVRVKGQVVGETSLKRPAPGKGIVGKLNVELKRT